MKLLTVVVPCYNSEDYMERCIDTLITGDDSLDIIIVNDGSYDSTQQIGERYAKEYPDIVQMISQKNGGHGAAVNTGLANAKGSYFKVVDSDDWVDQEALKQVLDTLRSFEKSSDKIDVLISNFVYEKVGVRHKTVMKYERMIPENRPFSWNDMNYLKKGKYFLMHSFIYRTDVLRDCHLELPRHTFYVDNLFVYLPLPYVETFYYLNVNLYHYFIGRDDQSVNEEVMIRRIEQQIKINKLMLEAFSLKEIGPAKRRKYMFNYLEIITTVTSILLIREGTKSALKKKKELWKYIKEKDYVLYLKMRIGLLGLLLNMPGKVGRKITVGVYQISRKIVGFN